MMKFILTIDLEDDTTILQNDLIISILNSVVADLEDMKKNSISPLPGDGPMLVGDNTGDKGSWDVVKS